MRVRNYRDWNAIIIREGQTRIPEKQILQQKDSIQMTPSPEKPKKEKKKKGNISDDDVYGG